MNVTPEIAIGVAGLILTLILAITGFILTIAGVLLTLSGSLISYIFHSKIRDGEEDRKAMKKSITQVERHSWENTEDVRKDIGTIKQHVTTLMTLMKVENKPTHH